MMIHGYCLLCTVVDYVSVRFPRIDRASFDLSRLPGIVADVVGKNQNFYHVRLDGISTWPKIKENYMPSPGVLSTCLLSSK